MILYINKNNEIKAVDSTTDTSLIPFEISEDAHNPFENWNVTKICCYAIQIEEGKLKGFYPYIDISLVERMVELAEENEVLKQCNASTQAQLDYVTMMSDIDI